MWHGLQKGSYSLFKLSSSLIITPHVFYVRGIREPNFRMVPHSQVKLQVAKYNITYTRPWVRCAIHVSSHKLVCYNLHVKCTWRGDILHQVVWYDTCQHPCRQTDLLLSCQIFHQMPWMHGNRIPQSDTLKICTVHFQWHHCSKRIHN